MRYLFLLITLFTVTSFAQTIEEPRPNNNGPSPKRSKRSIYITIAEKEQEIIEIAKNLNVASDSTNCLVEVKFIVNKAGIIYNSEIISNTCNNTEIEQEINTWLRALRFKGLQAEDSTDFTYTFTFGEKSYNPVPEK